MFSHVTIGAGDLVRAVAFFDAASAPPGFEQALKRFEIFGTNTVLSAPQHVLGLDVARRS